MSQKNWCEITVSGQKVKIDRSDLKRVQERSWRITKGTTGRKRVVTSIRTSEGVRSVTLGKFLMNPPKGKQVYCQRFNEGLDYRKENLIVCTLKERQRLLPKRRVKTSSQFRGVSFQKSSRKWRAGIEVEGVQHNLGEFETEEEAAMVFNKAARKFFGAKAYQNSIGRPKKPR